MAHRVLLPVPLLARAYVRCCCPRVRPRESQGGRALLPCARVGGCCRPSESSGAAEEFATEGGGGLREEAAEEAEEEGRKLAAVELEWIPETLYNTAISAVVDNYIRSRRDIRSLPENIQFDVYYKVRTVGLLFALLPQPEGPHRRMPTNMPPSAVSKPPSLASGATAVPG